MAQPAVERVEHTWTSEDIVPPQLQWRLQHLGYQSDLTEYEIGDIANLLQEELPGVPVHMIHQSVGQYCGKASDTVRGFAYVSGRVCEDIRVDPQFEPLKRSHHKAICDVAKGDEKKHREIAMEVLGKMDDYGGNVMPVGVLRDWLQNQDGAPPMWNRYLKTMRRSCLRINEGDAPAGLKNACTEFLKATDSL